jgi:hypothetical protein
MWQKTIRSSNQQQNPLSTLIILQFSQIFIHELHNYMEPNELIQLRRDAWAAEKAARAAAKDNNRKNPAIWYALNIEYMSEILYEILKNPPRDLNLGAFDGGAYYLMSLFKFRNYFENGNGNNFTDLGIDEYNRFLTENYLGVFGDKVHSECWVLAAEDVGQQSKLTDGVRFLLTELRPRFGDDEFDGAMERLEQRPNASKGQIAAARLYPDAFKAVLNTLLTGEGEGWLTHFVKHPLRKEFLRPQWGIYSNGNHHDLALCIPTNSKLVEITQGSHVLRMTPYEQRLIATVGLMRRAGIDPSKPCAVAGDSLPPLDFDSPHIARVRRNTLFSPFLENHADFQIQVAALWTAVPKSLNGKFGLGTERPTVDIDEEIPGFGRILKLALGSIDRALPKPLTFAERRLVNIGAAPEVTVPDADPWVQSLNEPETRFIFGDKAELEASDLGANEDAWSCAGDANLVWENSMPCIARDGNYGNKIAVNVDAGRTYPIRVVVRFLSPRMREAMSNEQAWQEAGLSWHPLSPQHEHFASAIAQAGLVHGRLSVGNEEIKVWVPSLQPHFWFRHGFNPPTQVDQAAEFASVDELTQRHLHIYIPPGTHQILWGGEPWLECEGPGYWEESLSEISKEWPLLQQSGSLELIGEQCDPIPLATIAAQQPNGDQLLADTDTPDDPEIDQFLAAEFDLDELASRMQSLRFKALAWPMKWSWSGQELGNRFDELFQHCQYMCPQVTRQGIRDMAPTLNSLREISKGNHSNSIWIPLSTFRLNNTAQPTEFFPLAEIQQNAQGCRIAILDRTGLPNNRRVLQANFDYSQNTTFTRPNQQGARPWLFHIWDNGQNTPRWLHAQAQWNATPQLTTCDLELTAEIFKTVIAYSKHFVATHADQRLAYAFLEISREFLRIAPHRAVCFQAAVMCRLHARMEAHDGNLDGNDDLLRLRHPRFAAWLQRLSRDICASESTREAFNSDLVTVDWALAWFHEPI